MNLNKIGIFYFSGTGNTKIISKLFAEEFLKHDAKVELVAIEDVLNNRIPFNIDYDMIGFGHPVHAFSAPKIFFEFIENLPICNETPSFYFKTAGDPLCNGGDTYRIRKKLLRKGYQVFYESLFVMPSNILFQYEDELIKQLFLAAQRKIRKIVNQILGNQKSLQVNNSLLRIFSYLFSKAESYGGPYFGKYLYVTDTCNRCNLCIDNCPTKNIYCDNDEISFGDRCTFCMRCVYTCPSKSIKNKYMNFLIIKKGYNIKIAIENPSLKGNFVSDNTKGYFKHFYKYLFKN